MTGALLEAHGRRTGVYLSPHTERWSERIRIAGAEIDADEFAAAAERVAQSIEVVNRDAGRRRGRDSIRGGHGDGLRRPGLRRGGARRDRGRARWPARRHERACPPRRRRSPRLASSTRSGRAGRRRRSPPRSSPCCATTRRWCWGGSVVGPPTGRADRGRAKRPAGCRRRSRPGAAAIGSGAYQRRNFAVAAAAAEAALGGLDRDLTQAVAEGLELPGRVELLMGDPPLVLDAAHNPDGARALAEALGEAVGEAAGWSPVSRCSPTRTRRASSRRWRPAPRGSCLHGAPGGASGAGRSPGRPGAGGVTAGELAAAAGVAATEAVLDPKAAVGRARALARERGGVALVTGSHYLLPYA